MKANHVGGRFFEEFIRSEFDQSSRLISAEGSGSQMLGAPSKRLLNPDGLREFDLTSPITPPYISNRIA